MAKTEVKKRQRTFEDLSDRRFGLLKVLYRADDYMTKSGKSYIMWHCKCECGNEIDVRGTNLKNNHTTSCGCTRKVSMISKNLEDLTDQTFVIGKCYIELKVLSSRLVEKLLCGTVGVNVEQNAIYGRVR